MEEHNECKSFLKLQSAATPKERWLQSAPSAPTNFIKKPNHTPTITQKRPNSLSTRLPISLQQSNTNRIYIDLS